MGKRSTHQLDEIKPAKKRCGPPGHQPTDDLRQLVVWLKEGGATHKEVGKVLGISHKTLLTHYEKELEVGARELLGKVAKNIYQQALYGEGKEALTAQMFIMKTRGRWRETNRLEHVGEDGKPIETVVTVGVDAPKQESMEEWQARQKTSKLKLVQGS